MLKGTLNNSKWMLFQQFFNYGISFLIGALVIRYLGPSDYGIVTFIIAIISILNPIIFLGSSNILPREITLKKEMNLTYSFLKLSFIVAFVFFSIISAVVFFSNYNHKIEFLILLFSVIFIPIQILNYNNNAILKSKRNITALLFATLITVPIKLFIIYYDLGLKFIITSFLLDSIFLGIFLILNSKVNFKLFLSSNIGNLKYLKQSIVFNISATIVFILYTRIDQLMIKFMLNNFELGIYGSNIKIFDAFVMLGFTLSLSLLPYLTKVKSELLLIKKIYKYFYFLFLPIIILLIFFSDLIINILFGNQFISGSYSLKILLISSFFAILTSLNNRVLIANELEKCILIRSIYSLLLNVILNLILIPKFGINGAAISTLFVTIFTAYLYDFFDIRSSFLNKYKFNFFGN